MKLVESLAMCYKRLGDLMIWQESFSEATEFYLKSKEYLLRQARPFPK